ncbi:carboxylesterase/lipase family protein [Novosphingobium sp. BL-52-GroH]|uniref:carboxylesterase/lipase family protein n=1 Tax=Novosphingobium sp. BL-52-GroH TaxID=3349877 RepID=UPI00384B447D
MIKSSDTALFSPSPYAGRRFVAAVALATLSAFPAIAGSLPAIVRTDKGRVAGDAVAIDGRESVVAYKGIPFAASTAGEKRWTPPVPAAAWRGVRASVAQPVGCMQGTTEGASPEMLPWTKEFIHPGPVGEDCLNLNVWTPAARSAKKLPVLVFIHGGGFFEGSNSVPVYDGARLAAQGIVVVTINYRLGAFGFLATPELAAESPHHAAGNYGLLDQLAALKWVRRNISAFGGDPSQVTISGQSSGAMSVYMMTASPLAKGLFQRAIVASGPGALASFGYTTAGSLNKPLENNYRISQEFMKRRGVSSISELRKLDARSLLPTPGDAGPRPRPTIDGWFLRETIDTVYRKGAQIDVPMMLGMVADETSALGYTPEKAAAGRDASRVAIDNILTARARTARTPAFAYLFDRAIPWPEKPQFGAFHTSDIVYAFGNLSMLQRPWQPLDRKVSEEFSGDWVDFVKGGKPGDDNRPWPAYQPGSSLEVIGN